MKITIATGIYPPEIGGPSTFLKEFVPILISKGYSVDVITYGVHREGVTSISRTKPFRWFSFLSATLKSAKNSDVIFTTDTLSSGLPSAIAALILRKPLVTRFVGDIAWEIGRSEGWTDDPFEIFQEKKYGFKIELIRLIQKFVLKKSKRVITVSSFLQSVLQKWKINRKIVVVPNVVKKYRLPPKTVLRKQFKFNDKFIIVSVGRLTKYKGIDKIVLMCKDIIKLIPDLILVIVGDGPSKDEIEKTIVEHSLEKRVKLVGRQDEISTRKYIKASDLLVLNSEYEGMSHTLLEAMTEGCPVVASAVCGNPELVQGRGLLFNYNEMDMLKEQIIRIYKDKKLVKKLVLQAKNLPSKSEWESKLLEVLNESSLN